MKSLIIYESNHGTVEDCVCKLEKMIGGDVEIIKASAFKSESNFSEYDNIIIGGSIHAGKVQQPIVKFFEKYRSELKDVKKTGLFLCSLDEAAKAEHYFADNFQEEDLKNLFMKGLFGGAVYFERYNFFIKFIMKKITKSDTDIDKVNIEAIEKFAEAFAS